MIVHNNVYVLPSIYYSVLSDSLSNNLVELVYKKTSKIDLFWIQK